MSERMYGGYPESCVRDGMFQLEGEQVIAIVRDLLAENAALRAELANEREGSKAMNEDWHKTEEQNAALREAALIAHGTMRRQFDKGEAPDWWGDDEHEAYSVLTTALANTHRTEGHSQDTGFVQAVCGIAYQSPYRGDPAMPSGDNWMCAKCGYSGRHDSHPGCQQQSMEGNGNG